MKSKQSQIIDIFHDQRVYFDDWIKRFAALAPRISLLRRNKKKIYQRPGFRFFVNYGDATSGSATNISVRYHGMEVGKVKVGKSTARLFYPTSNATYRGLIEPIFEDFVNRLKGHPWDSPEVADFFKKISGHRIHRNAKGNVKEHEIQSELFKQLLPGFDAKVEALHGIAGIDIGGFPNQLPMPIKPSEEGVLEPSTSGHTDILARTKINMIDGRCGLAVLEIKAPRPVGDSSKALTQSYFYAACFALALEMKDAPELLRRVLKWPLPLKTGLRAIRFIAYVPAEEISAIRQDLRTFTYQDLCFNRAMLVPGFIGYRYKDGVLSYDKSDIDLDLRGEMNG